MDVDQTVDVPPAAGPSTEEATETPAPKRSPGVNYAKSLRVPPDCFSKEEVTSYYNSFIATQALGSCKSFYF
jgi:hypothetical protein